MLRNAYVGFGAIWVQKHRRMVYTGIRKNSIKQTEETILDFAKQLALEFKQGEKQVENVISLIDEGNTIPFIARYRKELTGAMDDQILRELSERLEYLRGLHERKTAVAETITAAGAMTEELQKALDSAVTLAEVEDIYRPYKPKRKTRASMAKEKGLEGLALQLMAQQLGNPLAMAQAYLNEQVETAEDALQGARDILAETVSDDAAVRKSLREYLMHWAVIATKAADADKESVYSMYYDREEQVARIAPHRVLAINRGEKEGFLKVSIKADQALLTNMASRAYVRANNECGKQVQLAVEDAVDRLIFPSLEREIRAALSEAAQENAIGVFAMNLRHLLLQPPIKGKVALGLDPAYRTGCKIAVVDQTGKVLATTVIYPTPPQSRVAEAKAALMALIRKHGVEVIAIGNGTASRESEKFVAELIGEMHMEQLGYVMVSEAGASVYSASKLAAEEFPEYDVSLRSAVSIARRLQDPLAELVKIDPKAIGVGQYQHDMPPKRMDEALGGVVESCVNQVGVDLNTASSSLLGKVSGLSAAVAKNIVTYREENGAFPSRKALTLVPKLGKKAFEQSAGFLRVPESAELMDNTGIHPESYAAAKALLKSEKLTMEDVRAGNTECLKTLLADESAVKAKAEALGIGEPTLRDILADLLRPGRDMRDDLPRPVLRTDVMDMNDLTEGMQLQGTVRNVVDFGAFVDIGVHEDGLVHVSRLGKRVRTPSEVVKVGDIVTVWVLAVDKQKKRISLTMEKPPKA